MHDHDHMQQCLDLAVKGHGFVHPNPMVGAVLVRRGSVIATGYHRRFGGRHAERECLQKAGRAARGATLFVNLEPCAHFGKTPPCVDAIISSGVASVVIGMKDPNPLVSGRGIAALRRAGLTVKTGLLRQASRALNEKFVHWHETGRPFIALKWAQSLDGFVADGASRSRWITGSDARRYAHYLRSGYDAILVGAGTVRKDNPRLTVRHVGGRDPVRIVLDARLLVTGNERVFGHRTGRTIVLTAVRNTRTGGAVVRRLLSRGCEVIGIDGPVPFHPRTIRRVLADEGITSVLVEGGPTTISGFYESRTFDAYHVFIRASLLGKGMPALTLKGRPAITTLARTKGSDVILFEGGDLLVDGRPVS